MFSGFDAKDIYYAIYKKLDTIKLRIDEESKKKDKNTKTNKKTIVIDGESYDIPDAMSILDFIFCCCK